MSYRAAVGQFRYRTLDASGDQTEGVVEAQSFYEASEKLRAAEINVISIEGVTNDTRRYEPDGPRPDPAPRDVRVRIREMPGGWVLLIVGGIFTAIALVFVLTGLGLLAAGERAGAWLTLFPLIHLAVGVGLLWYVLGRRRKRQGIYRDGDVAMATIDGVGYNRSLRVNGRNPYEMTWSFDVNGHRFHDKKSSFDDRLMTFAPGDRLWVIYDPNDPEESAEWPPLAG